MRTIVIYYRNVVRTTVRLVTLILRRTLVLIDLSGRLGNLLIILIEGYWTVLTTDTFAALSKGVRREFFHTLALSQMIMNRM